MSQQPTLSVVFPNYNHARFLPESLGAILAQSYRPAEIIIIDDASKDNSVEVIEGFACQEPRLRLIRNKRNMGVEYNINRLIEMASGDYIFLSAADDKVLPGFFEKSMKLLAQYPQAGLCSAVVRLIGENGEDRGIRAMPVISNKPCFFSPEEVRHRLCKYGRWITISSMIMRRDAVIQEGGQHLELGSFADTFLALLVSLRHGACFIPEPLGCWRQMDSGHGSELASDWEGLSEVGMLASRLMRNEYRDLFPTDYVDRFERHWMYMVGVTAGKRAHIGLEQALSQGFEKLCPKPSFVDRAFWSGMRLFIWAQARAWQIYSMAKFGPWRWWILGRLSILVNLRKLVIFEKLDT
ncbi:glycosyltransferase [bacterium]|nr:glycosyltransferase [bacterium]